MDTTTIRCIVVGLLLVGGQPSAQTERRVIRVTAERFAFTPSRIVIQTGEDVELRIRSDDTAHGFRIGDLGINVTLQKRGKGDVRVPLRVDTPGRYVFECSRMCGAGHNFMRGELVVRDPAQGGRGR
jgi:cytochrome c oxidase subunit II